MFRTSPVHHQERFVQAVFADLLCGNTRTTRHVQPLRTCRKNCSSAYNFVQPLRSCRKNFFLQLRNGWTCRVVRVLPHTKVCKYSFYKTLLMMDRWGPKHVELNLSADQNLPIKTTLCILLDYIYILKRLIVLRRGDMAQSVSYKALGWTGWEQGIFPIYGAHWLSLGPT